MGTRPLVQQRAVRFRVPLELSCCTHLWLLLIHLPLSKKRPQKHVLIFKGIKENHPYKPTFRSLVLSFRDVRPPCPRQRSQPGLRAPEDESADAPGCRDFPRRLSFTMLMWDPAAPLQKPGPSMHPRRAGAWAWDPRSGLCVRSEEWAPGLVRSFV